MREKMISRILEFILKMHEEKEACYCNGEWDENVELALLSNYYKLVTFIFEEYKEAYMREEVKKLFDQRS